jgi:hypothetical protein
MRIGVDHRQPPEGRDQQRRRCLDHRAPSCNSPASEIRWSMSSLSVSVTRTVGMDPNLLVTARPPCRSGQRHQFRRDQRQRPDRQGHRELPAHLPLPGHSLRRLRDAFGHVQGQGQLKAPLRSVGRRLPRPAARPWWAVPGRAQSPTHQSLGGRGHRSASAGLISRRSPGQ